MMELTASAAAALACAGVAVLVLRPAASLGARLRPHIAPQPAERTRSTIAHWFGRFRGHLGAVSAGVAAGGGAGAAVAVLAGWTGAGRWAVAALGALAGGARPLAKSTRELEQRRTRMVTELATVNQLLAVRVRTGGSVHQALAWLTARTDGLVADELRRALGGAEAGLPLADALQLAARSTDEPACARTYLLLAAAAERGVDLASELVRVAADVRRRRRVALRRMAAGRRAAMLLPIVAVLAPVMLLFVAAPLPSLFAIP
jgi:tight adherence protein C